MARPSGWIDPSRLPQRFPIQQSTQGGGGGGRGRFFSFVSRLSFSPWFVHSWRFCICILAKQNIAYFATSRFSKIRFDDVRGYNGTQLQSAAVSWMQCQARRENDFGLWRQWRQWRRRLVAVSANGCVCLLGTVTMMRSKTNQSSLGFYTIATYTNTSSTSTTDKWLIVWLL